VSFDNVACPKCGKVFRFRESMKKYHGWCISAGIDAYDGAPAHARGIVSTPDDLDTLLDLAEQAGRDAVARCIPTPMIVRDDMTGHVYAPVMDGVCGFAWVHVKGNTKLAHVMEKRYGRSFGKDYPTGRSLWIHDYNQSMTKKSAYAHAYAKVLRDAGHDHVYADERMD
jgi:hypothetical protein